MYQILNEVIYKKPIIYTGKTKVSRMTGRQAVRYNKAMKKDASKKTRVHMVPNDLKKALSKNEKIQEAWKDRTPLAQNEWICWVISAKKQETRERRIQRACEELAAGKRRPCCWAGCPHR